VSLPAVIAALLGISLTAYGTLAGADFGAGILDLVTGGRPAERGAIAAAIGPVWEANHVWLIFSITILFSAFPPAFSALGTALLAPLTVALLAIVVRGVALALRAAPGTPARGQALLSRLFGAASLAAPFAFGVAAGGIAEVSSSPRSGGAHALHVPWAGPFALLIGGLAVALCAQLASSFVASGLVRAGEPRRAEPFRRSGLQAGACVLVLALAAPLIAATTASAVWRGLVGPALPLVIAGLGAQAVSLLALARGRYFLARHAGLLAAAAVLWGWFEIQAPRLIGSRLTIHTSAATHPALAAVAISSGVVLLLVLPAMYLLFALFARPELEVIE
jgi:cytochrome d ubiquinol oxidase subunit II